MFNDLSKVLSYNAKNPRFFICESKFLGDDVNVGVFESEVIKQADTLEELCDEFVGIDTQGHYIIHNDDFIKGARIIPLEDVKYFGAIWTDKGLIYVAKMNEKGELELLWKNI